MQITTVLDVAIGLAFTFFMLAMLTSGAQELIAGVFRWRGTYLAKAIEVLLSNQTKQAFAWQTVGNFLRAHVTPCAARPLKATQTAMTAVADNKATPEMTALVSFQTNVTDHPLLVGTPAQLPSYISADDFATAILTALRDGSRLPLFSQAESVIGKLPAGKLKTLLTGFVEEAGGDMDKLRAAIEQWFDNAMDRAQGIYKRYVQWFLLLIGLIFAIAFNVDTFKLASDLWVEPPSAAAIVAYAGSAGTANGYTDPSTRMGDITTALRNSGLPIGWSLAPSATPTVAAPQAAGAAPVKPAGAAPAAATPNGPWWYNPGLWSHIPGWLVTAFAVSLGAPFWFQLLNNFVNLRNTGAKPDKADGSAPS